ncbi:hypothetical protein DPMN_043057 [Dreissena polymorpha]|uniref:Transmembrane protein n=1 Tax=Dreissena polymorpha TaxID=45954 RepID=A0A9D4D368_DREPO|nr:hypothetical protein DPMN_043057 [Dreissena polymorpha]
MKVVMWIVLEGIACGLSSGWDMRMGYVCGAYGWSIELNMRVGYLGGLGGWKIMVVYVCAARGDGMWVEHDGGVGGWSMRVRYRD